MTTLLHMKCTEKIKVELELCDGGPCLNKEKLKLNVFSI